MGRPLIAGPVYTDAEPSVRVYDLTRTLPHTHTHTCKLHTCTQHIQHIQHIRNQRLSSSEQLRKKKTLPKMDKVLFHISDNKYTYILAVLVLRSGNGAVVSATGNREIVQRLRSRIGLKLARETKKRKKKKKKEK